MHQFLLTAVLCLNQLNVPQPIMGADNNQLNLVVVFDDSGSMDERFSNSRTENKLQAAKSALKTVLQSLPANTNVGIISFHGWAYDLNKLDMQKATKAINGISAYGGTPLGGYMKIGANALLDLRNKNRYGIYKLLIITDGESNDDIEEPLSGQYGIMSKGLIIEAIGVDMDSKHTLATKVKYYSAMSHGELASTLRKVLAETINVDPVNSDFDVIAPLGNELSQAILTSLATVDNTHIGEEPPINSVGSTGTNTGGGGGGCPLALLGILLMFGIILSMSHPK